MKKKKTKRSKKTTKISKKPISHEKWLEGYWKWRKHNGELLERYYDYDQQYSYTLLLVVDNTITLCYSYKITTEEYMNENTKTYIAMFIGCLFVVIYLKYLHDPLIELAIQAVG